MTESIMPMAWNEPGGNKNNDPWGNRNRGGNNDEGPPDLDQIFKKFMDSLNSLFGSGKPSGGISGSGGGIGLSIVLVLFVLGYLAAGLFTVSPYEQGIITRFGKYNRTVTEGLHWTPRFVESVTKINTENIKSSRHSGWMLTKDENIVLAEIEVQYRVIDPEKYMFNVSAPDSSLRQAADSALRQVIGGSLTDDVLTDKKQQIAELIKEQLKETLDVYDAGFHVSYVNFKDSRPPDQVKEAFDDVTKSREDLERLKLQADAYASKIVPEAEGMARKLVLEAEAYKEEVILDAEGKTKKFELVLPEFKKAPEVTRTRMYLDVVQQVMQNTSKVMVDLEKGSNSLVYLPLDKIMQSGSATNNQVARNDNSSQGIDPTVYSNLKNAYENAAKRRKS